MYGTLDISSHSTNDDNVSVDSIPSTSSSNPRFYGQFNFSPFKAHLEIDPKLLDPKKLPKKKPSRPYAVSGREAYDQMVRKQEEKQAEQQRKEIRKKEREDKKKLKGKKQQKKNLSPESDESDLETHRNDQVIYDESDDDVLNLETDNECAACGGNEEVENAEVWLGCQHCPRWFHKYCVEGGYESMSLDELRKVEFICNTCLKKNK